MNTVLITAYAVNPYKGSEDGMGWNYIRQAAVHHKVIAVTRHNNRPFIEDYMQANRKGNELVFDNISFLYFDWPPWMLFWKKGPMLSMIYYYFWQLSLALWLSNKKLDIDLVHNLNFHNDWTPSFLWLLGKKMVWGPVGHHPKIPANFLNGNNHKEWLKDRMMAAMKWWFWHMDPFLYLTKRKADMIWCMHPAAVKVLGVGKEKIFLHPSVAAAPAAPHPENRRTDEFMVLSVGRFVSLKGFDVTVRSFALFYKALHNEHKKRARLLLVGRGPDKARLEQIIKEEGIGEVTEILDWLPHDKVQELYGKASVFLFPSHEGAGMVVAEAMSYGTPVLCWNNDGPGNIVHPKSELKIDYSNYNNSINAFSYKLYRLFSDQTLYEKEAGLAVERFTQSLDWAVKSEQLKQLYRRALANQQT